MRKLFSLFAALTLCAGLWAEGSVFTYTATEKLESQFAGLGTVVTHEFNAGNGTVTYSETVTEIKDATFYYCSSLTSITLPEGVTTIGYMAFNNCTALQSVTIPASVTTIVEGAFYYCESLQSIDLSNVTTIGASGFLGCSTLQSVDLSSVTSIEAQVFYMCSALQSVTIPAGVTTIGNYAFCDCSGLKSVIIPAGVTTIGNDAFSGCSALQSITIPEGVTTLGEEVFMGSGLTSITIPASVTTIGEAAFAECTGLTSVTFLGNACQEGIGAYAFYDVGKKSPATLVLPANWTGTKPNEKGIWYTGKFNLEIAPAKTSVITYTATEKLEEATRIGFGLYTNAFYAADSTLLTITEHSFSEGVGTITLDGEVAIIGDYTFYSCEKLQSITIPASVTTIGEWAFASTGLTSITIPASVASIGEYAFYWCDNSVSVTFESNACQDAIGNYAFMGVGSTTPATLVLPTNWTGTKPDANGNWYSGKFTLAAPAKTSVITYTAEAKLPETESTGSAMGLHLNAFYAADSTQLTFTHTFDEGVGTITFNGELAIIGDKAIYSISALKSITLPESVTSIGEKAFNNCGLTSITIPASVTTIGSFAFYYCNALKSVTLQEGLITIKESAFEHCDSLQSITIPESVTSIGNYAFNRCAGVTSVTFLGNACQEAIGSSSLGHIGETTPALLTLPANWTGTKPDEDGNWYGGKFEMSSTPTTLPTLFGDGVKGNKFLHNGQLFIRKGAKTYNALGAEL
ncbi:MAG: leucine-rich repeat domain-containing protein [Paludibacteraceae bacterium]|nr:leucine-rich repeat domain-containing protein [Paludibacteraceae bacterium]